MKYYKFLSVGGAACQGGTGVWSLPTRGDDGTWTPGEWMPPVEGELMLCWNGYHLCMAENLLGWLAPRLYEAEGRGECVRGEDKIMFRQARLLRPISTYNERILRLFACDCAERALPLHEAVLDDTRPRECIATARRYANGEATGAELDAAWAAARDAAWDAAWDAGAAEKEWQTQRLMEYVRGEVDLDEIKQRMLKESKGD